MKELLDAIVSKADQNGSMQPAEKTGPQVASIHYGRELEEEIGKIDSLIRSNGAATKKYPSRWLAVKLLENDKELRAMAASPELDEQIDRSVSRVESLLGESPEIVIAGRRYGFIAGACQEAVRSTIEIRHTMSDRIDSVVTNRVLGISILLWAMTTFPGLPEDQASRLERSRQAVEAGTAGQEEKDEQFTAIDNQEAEAALEHSVAGRIGRAMEPAFRPMGFDWRIGPALIGAFAAKEVFVAQMGIVYTVGEADEESESLREILKSRYTPLVGFCIMLFCLVSAPCMATIAVTKRESNSWGWALFQLGGLTVLAYVLTVAVFQTGRLLGIGIG